MNKSFEILKGELNLGKLVALGEIEGGKVYTGTCAVQVQDDVLVDENVLDVISKQMNDTSIDKVKTEAMNLLYENATETLLIESNEELPKIMNNMIDANLLVHPSKRSKFKGLDLTLNSKANGTVLFTGTPIVLEILTANVKADRDIDFTTYTCNFEYKLAIDTNATIIKVVNTNE